MGSLLHWNFETNEKMFVNQTSGVLKYKLSNKFQKCVDFTVKEISLWRKQGMLMSWIRKCYSEESPRWDESMRKNTKVLVWKLLK